MKNIVVVVGMCGVGKSVTCDYLESLGYERIAKRTWDGCFCTTKYS